MSNPTISLTLTSLSALYIPANTDQPEELEEVDIGVEFVLNDL